ncbi:tetratricopeptide repeat protein [Roseateles sp.]|uniref:tetratricopeptide repeat protein n=1 Tax=Roseateles sp. TaxID=1971397 RepID=UPI003D11257B
MSSTRIAIRRPRLLHGTMLVVAVLCLTLHAPARSAEQGNFTAGEISLLPDFCQDRLNYPVYSFSHPKWAYWGSRMGETFKHVHHYCWALVSLRRASMTPNKEKRAHLVTTAINDLEYVISNATADFRLKPEVYARIGDAALQLENFSKAFDAYDNARQLKPGYPPAYTGWADVLFKAGQKDAARELIEEGLRHAPESPELRSTFRRYGGDPSKVVPHAPAVAASAVAPSAPASAAAGSR